MYVQSVLLICVCAYLVSAEKCDQTPPLAAAGSTPSPNTQLFYMKVQNNGADANGLYMPDQRYVISINANVPSRLFKWFMITIEEPGVDNSSYEFTGRPADVGSLKTLDDDKRSKYSERCLNSIENTDNSEKEQIEIHWLSPKLNDKIPAAEKVRIRAMVAENSELWYISPNLVVELAKDNRIPIDSPKYDIKKECNLCSEARYEVTFQGQWSRGTHPQNFPTNLDSNKYSYMVGASHDYEFVLWQRGFEASPGLKEAAEKANTTTLEEEIIQAMHRTNTNSTRTLIRGRKNQHPDMSRPSKALFRVDRLHHLFSVVIAFQPSPDWFLGASRFELCSPDGVWLDWFKLPLYPWDAGTMDGVTYENPTKVSMPTDVVNRVALGSFERESPFYQINLNDLNPFGHLVINLLDVYPLPESECESSDNEEAAGDEIQEELQEEPQMSESRAGCGFSEWSAWYPCVPDGECGPGNQFRTRLRMHYNPYHGVSKNRDSSVEEICISDPESMDSEFKDCYVECY